MSTNSNLPPLQVYVRNEFLFNSSPSETTKGHLVGVRSLQNQSLQFGVLLDSGALYTGLPINAIGFKEDFTSRSLKESIMWDNISSSIQVITYDTLRYMSCTVKIDNRIIEGEYLFTIDYIGENDLSRNAEHWKMLHVIKTDQGQMIAYPQYRIRFTDPALCDNLESDMPDKHNTTIYSVGK